MDTNLDNLTIGVNFLNYLKHVRELPKKKKISLMRHLCDGYASANFGFKGYNKGSMLTLDEGEALLWLAGEIAVSMGLNNFDHYVLEEIYNYPIGKEETPEQRIVSLKNRVYHSYHKGTIFTTVSSALLLARLVEEYQSAVKSKLGNFWMEVISKLEIENMR